MLARAELLEFYGSRLHVWQLEKILRRADTLPHRFGPSTFCRVHTTSLLLTCSYWSMRRLHSCFTRSGVCPVFFAKTSRI